MSLSQMRLERTTVTYSGEARECRVNIRNHSASGAALAKKVKYNSAVLSLQAGLSSVDCRALEQCKLFNMTHDMRGRVCH